ncbi:GNAT family N-acetyltransferase [Streptomyces sp. NBC_01408]|uniref:GNAT family N-acetyltransferase n=1 Tax=Streptomyces sp. NBC_01408 TaxID=2903855 RepID=UPI00225249A3|nr:GNAT family N-acetyltransferase [Streptomyces sp. NBC_01408]MCX4691383.1 GNAT family N-acetyltransferase [Streptomyces sp. NBC_01408]
MEPALSDITLSRHAHDDLPAIRQTLLEVHADAYADRINEEFVQRFPWFVDHWGGNPGFTCVIAWECDVPVGFSYGAPAAEGRQWWQGHLDTPPADPATLHVSELMVRPKWRRTGLGPRLHDALLEGRGEASAVLTVDTRRPRLQAMYEGWGYRKIGENQPFADSPVYAVMLLERSAR